MISIREIKAIVRNYPDSFQPTHVEPLGSAGGMSGAQFWRTESPSGRLMLRRWPMEHPSPERLRLIHDVLFHAAKRGVAFLPVPIRTTDGESFVCDAGHLWELAPWMPGVADYEGSPSVEKLGAAMAALAKLHVAVSDFPTVAAQLAAGVPAIARRLAKLKELANGGAQLLSQSVKDSIWPDLASLAHTFLATLPRCVPREIRRLEPLVNLSLPLQPCLRDIWHDHVLFTGNDVTGLIDFGAVDIDTPATDVARLLGSLVGDDRTGWSNGVAAYSTIRPLTTDEALASKALDTSGTFLAGCNWLRWISMEGRDFDDRARIIQRFQRIVARCEFQRRSQEAGN